MQFSINTILTKMRNSVLEFVKVPQKWLQDNDILVFSELRTLKLEGLFFYRNLI